MALSSVVIREGLPAASSKMVEAGEQFVARGVVQHEAAADAAADGEQVRLAEAVGQALVAAEDDGQELAGIEFFGAQDAQLAKDGGQGLLGLIDEEDGTRQSRRRCVRSSERAGP